MTNRILCVLIGMLFLAMGCGQVEEEPQDQEPPSMSKDEAEDLAKADSLIDYCEIYDWYGDGICDEFCLRPDPDCETEEQPYSFAEFFERFNGAELPGCGTFELCWYNYDTEECTAEQTPAEMHQTLDFWTNRGDPYTGVYLAMNREEELTIEVGADGLDRVHYQETFPKSMPPGPGSEVGFLTRYTMTIEARGSEVERLTIYQEDYDPRTDTWEPWFDIRFQWDNPLVCEEA